MNNAVPVAQSNDSDRVYGAWAKLVHYRVLFDSFFNEHLSVFFQPGVQSGKIGAFVCFNLFNLLTAERARILRKNHSVLFAESGKFSLICFFKIQPLAADEIRKSLVKFELVLKKRRVLRIIRS